MDIKQACRNVPVNPADRRLLGMQWKGQVYIDTALPFGLRSAPLTFTAAGIAEEDISHYIDDFVTLGPPGSSVCQVNKSIMHSNCEEVGLPSEPEKDVGPATTLTFLGMEIDSIALEIRLLAEKLSRLQKDLGNWRGRKAGTKRELLSLIGMPARQSEWGGLSSIDLSTTAKKPSHYIRLSRDARSDIEWCMVPFQR